MPKTLDSCEPNCPGRSATCHATCVRYKKARAKYEKYKAQYSYNVADEYMYNQLKNKREGAIRAHKKAKPYKGRICNFK